MLTDQTPELSFGLGDLERVLRVLIERNGNREVILAPPINTKMVIK